MIKRLLATAILTLFGISAQAETLRMAVTTSFNNSGLSDVLLPVIEEETGITVQLLIVGTGQALRLGRAGDVDAILVHSRPDEETFVSQGFGTHRREIMFNDFVIVGPKADPAGIASTSLAADALSAIATARSPFVSRGDESGTHKRELALWEETTVPQVGSENWYRAVGAGMGASLNTAAGLNAYILSDRASWLNFGNKAGLVLLFEGDPVLNNQYAFIPVHPARHSHVRHEAALKLEAWLTSERAKELIDGYQVSGQALFTFNAN